MPNGGMTECGRCGMDNCICDNRKIKLEIIFDNLEGRYTLEFKLLQVRKGILLELDILTDAVKKGNCRLEDVEALERLVAIEKEILHPRKWWQIWKRS